MSESEKALGRVTQAMRRMQELGSEIGSGSAWWRTFELHAVAQEDYLRALQAYLAIA